MDWGILQGLGQGLQTVGAAMYEEDEEKRRAKMAQKLEEDREKRREAAELRKVDKTEFREMSVGGESILQKVFINSNGDVLRTEMPSATEIQDYNSGRKRLSLQDTLLEAQVGEYQRKAAREKTVDERDDAVFDAAGGVAGEAQRKRIQGGQETSAAQRLQSETSIQNALTRGAGKGSGGSSGDEEDIDFIDIADDFKKQDPSTYLDVGKIVGTTSDGATKAVIASLIQELTAQFPDRKLSAQDIVAAARAYKNRWKPEKDSTATTSISTRLNQ